MTIHYICSTCGSSNVGAEATAEWNAAKGSWELGTVQEDRFCNECCDDTTLIKVDEAEGLEIQVSGMIEDGYNNFRLVEDHETPAFFDIMIRTTFLESGDILSFEEQDNLSREECDKALAALSAKYPDMPVNSFYGLEN